MGLRSSWNEGRFTGRGGDAALTARPRLRVLVVEDSDEDTTLLLRELRRSYDVEHERVETADAMRGALDRSTWDLVVSDYSLPTFDAPSALAVLAASKRDVPCIVVSGTIGEETAVDALRSGAKDFLVKGRLSRLVPAVERELAQLRSRTARRAAEASLQRSEARFRVLSQSGVIGVVVVDAAGIVIEANDAWLAMTGWSADDVVKRAIAWSVVEEASPAVTEGRALASFASFLSGSTTRRFAGACTRRDGTTVPVLVGLTATADDDTMAVVVDLSELRDAEEARRESEAHARLVLDVTQEALLGVDRTGRVTFANAACRQLLGDDVAIGVDVRERIPFAKPMIGVVAESHAVLVDHHDGSEMELLCIVVPLHRGGRHVGAVLRLTPR